MCFIVFVLTTMHSHVMFKPNVNVDLKINDIIKKVSLDEFVQKETLDFIALEIETYLKMS